MLSLGLGSQVTSSVKPSLMPAPRYRELPSLGFPTTLYHSPVTICDVAAPHPGGPLGQGRGLSPLGCPREVLESFTD